MTSGVAKVTRQTKRQTVKSTVTEQEGGNRVVLQLFGRGQQYTIRSNIRYSEITDTPTMTPFDPRSSLPGFNLPLNFKPRAQGWEGDALGEGKDLFRNALDTEDVTGGYIAMRLTPLRELTMLRIMNHITDKPDWHIKVFDEEIASKWKKEALSAEGQDVTNKMVEWVIAELRYKAKGFAKTGFITVFDADVVKSDTAIPAELKHTLREAVSLLEDIPDHVKDWHPGSEGKVLDLVHPSLFPLVYGRSRILENKTTTLEDFVRRTGEGTVIPVPPEEEKGFKAGDFSSSRRNRDQTRPFSNQFQWLPCDVELSKSGKDVKIVSYINNLHPFDHKKLYGTIEQIISRTIPLWNQTLTYMKGDLRWVHWERIPYDSADYDPDPEDGSMGGGPQEEDYEDEIAWSDARDQWCAEVRKVVRPEPGEFSSPVTPNGIPDAYYDEDGLLKGDGTVDIFRDYQHRGLQIIVKLANIHLTPEKPEYEGGSWHVEGQLNEHICASAIYYYDCENVTTSRLSFRQQVSNYDAQDVSYKQDYHEWLTDVFGCEQDGSVVTSEDRLLTWPNILQHQVQPFRLADPTKPGHRKILALFLVDPHIRVISTANVPCQRKDWWAAHVKKLEDSVARLPLELQDKIHEEVDFPFTMEEAKELRLKLMEERSKYVVEMDEVFTQHDSFRLCEH